MKNLKKLSRETLKMVQGGYTPECLEGMRSMSCQQQPGPNLTYMTPFGCPPAVKMYCQFP
ncbi:bacteriocin-like protein [Chryseobacterium edaphi]|uniref:bacteriocin-like protein n=1 Tax=Chryseobacterium edaphi TaxID=2976532 RepID=UPI003F5FC65B